MKPKIYIAGKITGDLNYKAKFEAAQRDFEKQGYIVLNPSWMPQGLQPADYMRICFAMIDTADVIAFLPDFKQSAGAEVEHAYCCYIDKNIRHYEDNGGNEPHAAQAAAECMQPIAMPTMPDPAEDIKKAFEKELHKSIYLGFSEGVGR